MRKKELKEKLEITTNQYITLCKKYKELKEENDKIVKTKLDTWLKDKTAFIIDDNYKMLIYNHGRKENWWREAYCHIEAGNLPEIELKR